MPFTGPLDTTLIKAMRASFNFVSGNANLEVRLAYQMSNNGITWGTPTAVDDYVSTAGLEYNNSTVTSVTTDQRLFVRFGIQAKNTSSTSGIRHGKVSLRLQITPIEGSTLAVAGVGVWSNAGGSAAAGVFHPLTGPIPAESAGQVRPSIEAEATTSGLSMQPALQLSDDLVTWYSESGSAGGFTTFGSSVTGDDIDYGTDFADFTPATPRQYVRFGVVAWGGSSGNYESGLASLRVDYRKV